MVSFCLIILCLNIDALSYGVAYGTKKTKLKTGYIFSISLLSTLFFLISLYSSKYIYHYFNARLCEILNGLILITLGLSYIKPQNLNQKNTPSNNNFSLKKSLLECFAFSVDAIFTALLSGFSSNFIIFFCLLYIPLFLCWLSVIKI